MSKSSSHDDMQSWQKDSYLGGANAAYLDELYEQYLENPQAVSEPWREYFSAMKTGAGASAESGHRVVREQFKQAALQTQKRVVAPDTVVDRAALLQPQVDALILAYRQHGHRAAQLDPLGIQGPGHPALAYHFHGLTDADGGLTFLTRGVLADEKATLTAIIKALQTIYTGFVSVEYVYISDEEERFWLQQQFEQLVQNHHFSADKKKWILNQLIAADGLEKYLDIKYKGAKRFSIEGLDALIPQLNAAIAVAAGAGVKEVVLGMAHRGRLSVMLNVTGMPATELFAEFEGKDDYGETSGDVRYHLGYSADIATSEGPVHITLSFNPSHLEFINPVLAGGVRARQFVCADGDPRYAMGVLLHGDASFAGLGVVYESLNMANLRGYTVGGLLHIITNNQIGFTTSDLQDTRSSCHCSDVAKTIEAPVFHVNADHPELAVLVGEIATRYRMRFFKDVVINLVGYRRHGHQEIDEPTSSAPVLYQKIAQHKTSTDIYFNELVAQNIYTADDMKSLVKNYTTQLDAGGAVVAKVDQPELHYFYKRWQPFLLGTADMVVDTRVDKEHVLALAQKLTHVPESFTLVRPIVQLLKGRTAMGKGEVAMDWGFAENMAYATLLAAGTPVRLTGEDVRRGTFYHRQAFWFDANTGEGYSPLMHLGPDQARLQIYDSILNEAGVMGFEYGYSCTDPNSLVIWEAQYGDFANSAQVIIDQFVSSGWQKWRRLSGLTLLLPHGYVGTGPEHTSARLERYLQLAAQQNMQIVVPTTPAQIFHLLRRQVLRPFRHPLVVMSPKNLLRHKLAVSDLSELWTGHFSLLLPEVDPLIDADISRVILCTGKVYYDLLEKRRGQDIKHIAIIRIEQLYPFPYEELIEQLKRYASAKEVVWVQEEPKNQGAWYVSRDRLQTCLADWQHLSFISRLASAAPSVGYHALHMRQQHRLIEEALDLVEPDSVND